MAASSKLSGMLSRLFSLRFFRPPSNASQWSIHRLFLCAFRSLSLRANLPKKIYFRRTKHHQHSSTGSMTHTVAGTSILSIGILCYHFGTTKKYIMLDLDATWLSNLKRSFLHHYTFFYSGIALSASTADSSSSNDPERSYASKGQKWEEVYEDKNIKVFRRLLGSDGIYEFKCTGSYNDISSIAFVDTQNDLEYRKEWDENVIVLEELENDDNTNTQIVNWIVKFPYPMYARQYIYKRRRFDDEEIQRITVISTALDTKEYPDSGKYVRVTRYKSKLVIQAHTTLDKHGLDYTLTYYDDPRSSIPTMAYTWVVNRGGPYFMRKIYEAAKKREKSQRIEEK